MRCIRQEFMTKQMLSPLTTSFADALVALDKLHRAARDHFGVDDDWVVELDTLWWQLNRHAHDLEEDFGPETVEAILRRFCEGHCCASQAVPLRTPVRFLMRQLTIKIPSA